MKRFCAVIFVFLVSFSAYALAPSYRLSLRTGGILPDGKVEKFAPHRTMPMGAEFAVTFHPQWTALNDWNHAGIGAALSYWYLGDNQLLGHIVAPYVFLDLPLVKLPHFRLGIRPGIGIGFATKTYQNTIPSDRLYLELGQANQSIGSVTNFHFPEALYLEFPLRNGWSILAAAGWYHFSNGSTVQPNSGYNILSGEIGVHYNPLYQHPPTHLWDQTQDHRTKQWEVALAFTGGARQVYYKDQQTFFASTIQAAAYWRAHNIFRLGGGCDIFYDGAYINRKTQFIKTNLSVATPSDCWRIGVSVQPEFVFGDFTAGFHFGVYLYDPIKELEPMQEAQAQPNGRIKKGIFYPYDILKAGSAGYPDGWLYTQIVLRYHLPFHLFIQANMKAHLTKVEFVGIGLGTWF